MIYSYAFTLSRRAMVVTLDSSAQNLHMRATDHWLSNPQNVLVFRLDTSAWVGSEVLEVPSPKSMTTWTVDEVARWLEGLDMAGPAAFFRAQGVDSNDLMTCSNGEQLKRELGTTPFLARKVVSLRDRHVAAHM